MNLVSSNYRTNELEKYKRTLAGESEALIEVYFDNMSSDCWKLLFQWMSDKTEIPDCHHGRLQASELSLKSFLSGELSYMPDVRTSNGMRLSLSLSMIEIELDELTIDIERGGISSEQEVTLLLASLHEIGSVIKSKHYIVCPELKNVKLLTLMDN